MSLFRKKQSPPDTVDLRELLYGDVPLERWARSRTGALAEALGLGSDARAVEVLQGIARDEQAQTRSS